MTNASATNATIKPKRGEVWQVELDPIIGSEQAKTRPVVVMSGGNIGRPSVFVCVPITGFQSAHEPHDWYVLIAPTAANGLTKTSSADASQIRALDVERFEAKLGRLAREEVESVADAVAFCVGYKPPNA
jgi:mRNA interferase MazF